MSRTGQAGMGHWEWAIDRRLPWLGIYPLAVDLANTVIRSGDRQLDLLTTDAELQTWIDAERARFALAAAAVGHLLELRQVRDAIRALLFARVEGVQLPELAVAIVNQASARCPSVLTLSESGSALPVDLATDLFDQFLALIARSAIDTVATANATRLGVCQAPSCGMFFLPGSVRQTWCSVACGNRARVARHAGRRVRHGMPSAGRTDPAAPSSTRR